LAQGWLEHFAIRPSPHCIRACTEMGCSCSSAKQGVGHSAKQAVGHPHANVVVDNATPVVVPPPSLQYLVQCNHCGARLELCVPPDTAPGIRIETACAGCQRVLQVRLGHVPGNQRRSNESGLSTTQNPTNRSINARSDIRDEDMGQKALREAIEQTKRSNLVNELPHEKYNCSRHKELDECEFCLQDYVNGEDLMRLPCMHAFHSECVAPWLRKAGTCPICQIDACKAAGV